VIGIVGSLDVTGHVPHGSLQRESRGGKKCYGNHINQHMDKEIINVRHYL